MNEYQFNSAEATKALLVFLSPLALTKTMYPLGNKEFPIIIVNEPLQRPKQLSKKIDLQFNIDVWHYEMFKVSELFDLITRELDKLNIRLANHTTDFQDLGTSKWRKSGTFEVRYNTITNQYEINR